MKQKTIIAVSGTANIGKSMTISSLGRQIVAAGATTTDNISKNDYSAILAYKFKTIGIQTFGDLEELVKNGLIHFFNLKCDIIVIASKGYGATVKAIEEFAGVNKYRVIWTTPYRVWDGTISENDIKDYTASHIKMMIDDVILGTL